MAASLRGAAALIILTGCLSPRPATQANIFIEAQAGVRREARAVEVTVRGGPPGDLMPAPDQPEVPRPPRFPIDFVVVPLGGDASRTFEIEARAIDANSQVLTIVRLRGVFAEHASRSYRLVLEDRCLGIVCPAGQTCRSGACIPIPEPTLDAGVDLDAGPEPDAPPPPCGDDAECDDEVFCNGPERCVGGTCMPGARPSCDDGVACTMDVCEGTGCNHLPDSSRCDLEPEGRCDLANGCQYPTCTPVNCASSGCERASCESRTLCVRTALCAAGETCCGGACGCADTDPCTDDFCRGDADTGSCVHEPSTAACDDGDRCTVGEACSASVCGGGMAVTCADDLNPCTRDFCHPLLGCQHVADDTLPYSDGDLCTVGDRCSSGVAIPGTPMACDDAVLCTADRCLGGVCEHTPNDSACVAPPMGRCDPMAGCQYGSCSAATCVPANSCEVATCAGTVCNRVPACPGELCCAGTCCPDDGNPCTDTVCGPGGCMNVPNTLPCSVADPCMVGTCAAGACVASPRCAPSTTPCVVTTCTAGSCSTGAAPEGTACDDADLCSTASACMGGMCRPTTTLNCNDFNPCTSDSCVPASGCANVPASEGAPCGGTGCDAARCVGGDCRLVNLCTGGLVCCESRGRCVDPEMCL